MPGEKDGTDLKFLQWLIGFLLIIMAAITGFNTLQVSAFPEKFVQLDRYSCDLSRLEKNVDQINNKLPAQENRL